MSSSRQNRVLDIVGIGALNIDFTVTSEKMKSLQPGMADEVMESFEFGVERLVDESKIGGILSLLGRDSFRTTLGGSAFNTICAMASLGSGIRAGFAGMAGDGYGSLSFRAAMDEMSIDRTWLGDCGRDKGGLCISINQAGTRSFICYPGCNSRMAGFLKANYEGILKYVSGARLLHLTQFSNRETTEILERLISEAKRANPYMKVSCDPGYSWLLNLNLKPSVEGILGLSDFIFLNEKEFSLLAGEKNCQGDLEKAESILLSYGAEGAVLVIKKESEIKLYSRCILKPKAAAERTFPIDVISGDRISDATGAGDVFAAGFLTALLLEGSADMASSVGLGMELMRAKLSAAPENTGPLFERIFREWQQMHVDN
jgi:sugar/nucleoside kinase (ribokinase family)